MTQIIHFVNGKSSLKNIFSFIINNMYHYILNFNRINLMHNVVPLTFKDSTRYTIVEKLGEGSYGAVYKVHDNTNGQNVAVKILTKDFSEGIQSTTIREITNLKCCSSHPNILSLLDMHLYDDQVELVLDCCESDLRNFINKYQDIPKIYNKESIRKIIYQIIKGVSFMHSQAIAHRDLKPGNILIDVSTLHVKIGDFGFSRKLSIPIRRYTREVSTLWYRAPELLLGSPFYSFGIDIWGIGCILAELVMKEPLFEGNSEIEELKLMFNVFGTFNDKLLPGFEKVLNTNKLLVKKKGVGIVNHIKKRSKLDVGEECYDLLSKMLVVNQLKRISLNEALKHVSNIIYNNI